MSLALPDEVLTVHKSRSGLGGNPLVVQFWLLGIDAARGDLTARGFRKEPCAVGSSLYRLGDLTLHSRGAWLWRGDHALHYLRPAESFYLTRRPDPLRFDPEARWLRRDVGLALLEPWLLEHEAWIARRYGPHERSRLLDGPLPPRVRRLVTCWQERIENRLDLRVWSDASQALEAEASLPG
ncbi:hypothetical protein HNR42_001299 [Deinobacterium chartae]|uniref:Uncharacterized protein n=1 Tax=Deinobacterium chartae TaxID=521158 RepID=A0A841HYA9_9DEIO|nr:hypothetical protein [Deinobacterium chartae]MBB6097876.1 hypothetical protein [Deinobacterium chartae]